MPTEKETVTLYLKSGQDTARFGRRLGRMARPGDVILLFGDLGAGKTSLTQGIAAGLDVPADMYVTSPSFALMHEYPGRIPLFHMDFYRLSGEEDIEGAGLFDYFRGPGLTVIEWPDRLGNMLPDNRLDLLLTVTGATSRCCTLRPHGPSWQARIGQLLAEEGFRFSP